MRNLDDLVIKIGRLERRVAKLQTQRNYWQAEYKKLREVLDKFPFIENRHRTFTQLKEEVAAKKAMEARIKEQQALIERLLKEQKDASPK